MPEKTRVRIFIDFWNFQLNWNDYHTKKGAVGYVQIPWKDVLPNVLTAEAPKSQPAKFAGAHVYTSVNPDSAKDRNLSKWLHHTLSSYAGYSVDVKNRKPRRKLRCQEEDCKAEIISCPACKRPLKEGVPPIVEG